MLYREIMAVCSEIHTKHINNGCLLKNKTKIIKVSEQNALFFSFQSGGIYTDHCTVQVNTQHFLYLRVSPLLSLKQQLQEKTTELIYQIFVGRDLWNTVCPCRAEEGASLPPPE